MGRKSYELGRAGENTAVKYLEQQKFQVIDRNFRSHQGEIDIIAKDNDYLVFIEVKTYTFRSYTTPIYAVRRGKRESIIHAARFYLHKNKLYNEKCRFDVLAIYKQPTGQTVIDHIRNAFGTR